MVKSVNHWAWKWMLRPALVLVLMILIAKSIGYWLSPMDRRSFDQDAWLQGDTDVRASMAIGARNQITEGMDETNIVTLLGKPISIDACDSIDAMPIERSVMRYVYYLGPWASKHDSSFLWIYVAEGKVIKAEIGGF